MEQQHHPSVTDVCDAEAQIPLNPVETDSVALTPVGENLPTEETATALVAQEETPIPVAHLLRRRSSRDRARAMLIRTTVTGAMVALTIVLCRLAGINIGEAVRVDAGFLPIAFTAFLWGPLWSGAAYGAADLIGAALTTGINPFITLEKIFIGSVMGVLYHHRRKSHGRIGIFTILINVLIVNIIGDFLFMSFIFHFAFGYPWAAALTMRGWNALANIVLQSMLMYLCDIRLTTRLSREGEKLGV